MRLFKGYRSATMSVSPSTSCHAAGEKPCEEDENCQGYLWGYWKQHELPNVCPKDYWQLSEAARRTLRRMRRRPRLITAFWKQSSLWPE